MLILPASDLLVVVAGFLIAFVLAFGIGANDVANSFGTSVGSKAISLRTACILASICELAGSILIGARVSSTVRKDIIDISQFNDSANGNDLMMNGHLSALAGSCIWLLLATLFKLPVSGSHSIVGAVIGFSLVRFGTKGINWRKVGEIAGSWFLSPVTSGLVSVFVFFCIKKVVLEKENPLEPALMTLPFLYGIIIAINTFVVVIEALSTFGINLPLWAMVVSPIAAGLLTGLFVYAVIIPIQRKQILDYMATYHDPKAKISKELTCFNKFERAIRNICGRNVSSMSKHECLNVADPEIRVSEVGIEQVSSEANLLRTANSSESSTGVFSDGPHKCGSETDESGSMEPIVTEDPMLRDRPDEAKVFSFAQILTAMFGSFAHGGNDVSNAIGPLIGLWILVTTGEITSKVSTPLWILVYGGVGITVGLWVWGRRVIETIGEDLATITPSSGVAIEIGSALTVLIASKFGLPISTTHCKVGSVVCVGRFRSRENVNWRLFVNILLAWVITLPVAGGISALIMWLLTRQIPY
nr:Sodium dependent phosphate transporter 1 A [Hymenolepis microstoma]